MIPRYEPYLRVQSRLCVCRSNMVTKENLSYNLPHHSPPDVGIVLTESQNVRRT